MATPLYYHYVMNFELLNTQPSPEELARQKTAEILNVFEVPKSEEELASLAEDSSQQLQEEEIERFKRRKNFWKKYSDPLTRAMGVLTVVIVGSVSFPKVQKNFEDTRKILGGVENVDDALELTSLSCDAVRETGKNSLKSVIEGQLLNKTEEQEKITEEKQTTVSFENEDILDPETRKFISELFSEENPVFPKEQLKEVEHFVFSKEYEKMPERYGQNLSRSGHKVGQAEDFGRTVRVYFNKELYGENKDKLSKRFNSIRIASVIFHEVGHCNDWIRDSEMGLIERLRMLKLITERVNSEDRFTSDYVEAIDSPGGKKETQYIKATEYWAEICEEYFAAPEAFKIENPVDFKIVDDFIKKQSPGFDIFEAMKKIQKLANKHFGKPATELAMSKDSRYDDYDYVSNDSKQTNHYSELTQTQINKEVINKRAENKKVEKKLIKKPVVKGGHPFK